MRKLAARIAFSVVFAVTVLATMPLAAQNAPFKLGDPVEVMYAGKWTPGVITKPLDSGTYVVNNGNFVMYINEGPDNIRPRQMTGAQKAESDRDAQALAHRPTGNGIGAQYGAREPSVCRSRTAPPTAATVKQYVMCGMEGIDAANNLVLVTNVNAQMGAPRPYSYQQDSAKYRIDNSAPVIDIGGGYKLYQCGKPILGGGAFTATHNCVSYNQPIAFGSCYRDKSANWNCTLAGDGLAGAREVKDEMPPRGY